VGVPRSHAPDVWKTTTIRILLLLLLLYKMDANIDRFPADRLRVTIYYAYIILLCTYTQRYYNIVWRFSRVRSFSLLFFSPYFRALLPRYGTRISAETTPERPLSRAISAKMTHFFPPASYRYNASYCFPPIRKRRTPP